MDRFTNMMTYTKVVETGNFSEAARRLSISKAVVTKRINQLEALLNVRLLQRSTRRLSVTDSGLAYYERCLKILADVEDTEAAIGTMGLEPRGHLRVSCPASFAVTYLGVDLCEFQHRYPHMTIELMHNERAVNPIADGFDVCIQVLPVHAETVDQRPIAPARRVVVATPKYLEQHGTPTDLRELQQHRCIHNIYIEPQLQWVFHGQDGPITVPLHPIMLTNNGWLLRDAAVSNNCIAMLPLFFIEKELDAGALVPVLSNYRLEELWFTAYYPKVPHMPIKAKLFLDFLEAKYGADPPWEKRLKRALGPTLAGSKPVNVSGP